MTEGNDAKNTKISLSKKNTNDCPHENQADQIFLGNVYNHCYQN